MQLLDPLVHQVVLLHHQPVCLLEFQVVLQLVLQCLQVVLLLVSHQHHAFHLVLYHYLALQPVFQVVHLPVSLQLHVFLQAPNLLLRQAVLPPALQAVFPQHRRFHLVMQEHLLSPLAVSLHPHPGSVALQSALRLVLQAVFQRVHRLLVLPLALQVVSQLVVLQDHVFQLVPNCQRLQAARLLALRPPLQAVLQLAQRLLDLRCQHLQPALLLAPRQHHMFQLNLKYRCLQTALQMVLQLVHRLLVLNYQHLRLALQPVPRLVPQVVLRQVHHLHQLTIQERPLSPLAGSLHLHQALAYLYLRLVHLQLSLRLVLQLVFQVVPQPVLQSAHLQLLLRLASHQHRVLQQGLNPQLVLRPVLRVVSQQARQQVSQLVPQLVYQLGLNLQQALQQALRLVSRPVLQLALNYQRLQLFSHRHRMFQLVLNPRQLQLVPQLVLHQVYQLVLNLQQVPQVLPQLVLQLVHLQLAFRVVLQARLLSCRRHHLELQTRPSRPLVGSLYPHQGSAVLQPVCQLALSLLHLLRHRPVYLQLHPRRHLQAVHLLVLRQQL